MTALSLSIRFPLMFMLCFGLISKFSLISLLSLLAGHNGTINGQGQAWWKKFRQKRLNYTRGPLVQIMWSSDIVITNITLRDSPFWTFHPYDCKNITVKGVTILAPVFEAPNTDGIDPGKYLLLSPILNIIS
jgi:polygalacturonase